MSLTKVVVMAIVMRVVRPSTLVGSASGRAVDIILVVMHHQCVCSGIGKLQKFVDDVYCPGSKHTSVEIPDAERVTPTVDR